MVFLVVLALALPVIADDKKKDEVEYKLRVSDPILVKIEKMNDDSDAKKAEITDKILAEIAKEKAEKRAKRKTLRFDMSGIVKPESTKEFKSYYHFDPVPQYYTGTCWSYSQTSMFESEIYRLHGKKVKLSEMYTVYYEYIAKAMEYLRTRGNSHFAEGSEGNALARIWKKHGIVPASAYDGIVAKDGLHNHTPLHAEMESYLDWAIENEYTCEKSVEAGIRLILNKYMGEPPAEFMYEGKKYTPKSFLKEVVKLNVDDYVEFQSTLAQKFYTKGPFEVEDNWWNSKEYYNIPLGDFMWVINNAIKNGYTLAIGGDVSEPGYNGWAKAQVVPTFDIPAEYIDQNSREFRIYNETTTDDHGLHMVGFVEKGGHTWYLIKDSARSSRATEPRGYHYFRDDYIKLKMLTVSMHKDAAKKILAKFKKDAKPEIELEPDGVYSTK